MKRLLIVLFLIVTTGYGSASFDRDLAQRECSRQWQGLKALHESCLADLERQFDILEDYKATLDPERVTLDERWACEKSYPTKYLDQRNCLEHASACHYRDLHGKHPIEEDCP